MEEHRCGAFAAHVSPACARVRAAVLELGVELGVPSLTSEIVCERSGVEPDWFARRFDDVAACCMQVYIAEIDEFDRVVWSSIGESERWRDRLRAAAYAAFEYVQRRPLETRFALVSMLEAGEEARVYRDRYIRRLVDLIDEGRAELPDPAAKGRETAVAIFGAVYEFIVRQVGRDEDLAALDRHVPQLMAIAVRPYLGDEAARAELSIPPPRENPKRGSNP